MSNEQHLFSRRKFLKLGLAASGSAMLDHLMHQNRGVPQVASAQGPEPDTFTFPIPDPRPDLRPTSEQAPLAQVLNDLHASSLIPFYLDKLRLANTFGVDLSIGAEISELLEKLSQTGKKTTFTQFAVDAFMEPWDKVSTTLTEDAAAKAENIQLEDGTPRLQKQLREQLRKRAKSFQGLTVMLPNIIRFLATNKEYVGNTNKDFTELYYIDGDTAQNASLVSHENAHALHNSAFDQSTPCTSLAESLRYARTVNQANWVVAVSWLQLANLETAVSQLNDSPLLLVLTAGDDQKILDLAHQKVPKIDQFLKGRKHPISWALTTAAWMAGRAILEGKEDISDPNTHYLMEMLFGGIDHQFIDPVYSAQGNTPLKKAHAAVQKVRYEVYSSLKPNQYFQKLPY